MITTAIETETAVVGAPAPYDDSVEYTCGDCGAPVHITRATSEALADHGFAVSCLPCAVQAASADKPEPEPVDLPTARRLAVALPPSLDALVRERAAADGVAEYVVLLRLAQAGLTTRLLSTILAGARREG